MKDFLKGGPAIAAGLYLQNLFEIKHGEQESRRIIEEYRLHGGDGGITQREMRIACELPAQPKEIVGNTSGLPVGITVEEDSQPNEPSTDDAAKLRAIVIEYMMVNDLDCISKTHMMKVKIPPAFGSHPPVRCSLWESFASSSEWVEHRNHLKNDYIAYRPILKTKN